MIMQDDVTRYLDYNRNRWSETTIKSETSRLKLLVILHNRFKDPLGMYKELSKSKKPYTIKTCFIRLNNMLRFLGIDSPYITFIKDYSNLFKNAYVTEKLEISFENAEKRINTMTNIKVRNHCIGLLYTGLRADEVNNLQEETVLGKGSKHRAVFGKRGLIDSSIPYITVYTSLKRVGLKPHSLRKLFATKLAMTGVSEADLCKVMGWNSFDTAKRYLQGRDNEVLSEVINGLC